MSISRRPPDRTSVDIATEFSGSRGSRSCGSGAEASGLAAVDRDHGSG
jgi:hypothetical protein